jgi:hypothetical protein
MARTKVSTTVYLTPEQVAALHQLHLRSQIPTAQLIRNAISEYLERCIADGRLVPIEVATRSDDERQNRAPAPNELETVIRRVLADMLPEANEATRQRALKAVGEP